jgi:thiol-disulfide isomerase/thioredoxin
MKKLLAVAFAAAFTACGGRLKTDKSFTPVPAADFALQDLSGATLRLSDYRGKTVLLDFWATWCEPCKQSIPRYVELHDQLASKGFVVIGVDEGEDAGIVKAYALRLRMNYPVLLDPKAALFHKYRGGSLPAAFLIDAQGNIRGRWEGYDAATGVDVERAIARLLGVSPRI